MKITGYISLILMIIIPSLAHGQFNFWNGMVAPKDKFTSIFSAFPASTVTTPCSGTQTVYKTRIGCQNQYGTNFPLSRCTDEIPSTTYSSPAGDTSIGITYGSRVVNCPAGSTTQTYVSGTCTRGNYSYTPASISGTCVFSDPCAGRSVTQGCTDGTVYLGSVGGVRYHSSLTGGVSNIGAGLKYSTVAVNTGAFDQTDGRNNVNSTILANISQYPIFNFCYNNTSFGKHIGYWYVPASAEIISIFQQGALNGLPRTPSPYYWSSTQDYTGSLPPTTAAMVLNANGPSNTITNKVNDIKVFCVGRIIP